ncbi:hypothetical protein ACQ4WX_39385 [Streptomyces lasalocidi]
MKANVLFFEKLPPRADGKPHTQKLWVYDFRTNQHFTLKQNRLSREHLDDFVASYAPGKDRSERTGTDAFKAYDIDYLLSRERVNLLLLADLKDNSIEDADDLIEPHVLAEEIAGELEAALSELINLAEALRPAEISQDGL